MPEKILELLRTMSLTEKQISDKLDLSIEEVNACLNHLYMTGFCPVMVLIFFPAPKHHHTYF